MTPSGALFRQLLGRRARRAVVARVAVRHRFTSAGPPAEAQHVPLLLALGLRHDDDAAVARPLPPAPGRSRVCGGALDDDAAREQGAARLGVLHDPQRRASSPTRPGSGTRTCRGSCSGRRRPPQATSGVFDQASNPSRTSIVPLRRPDLPWRAAVGRSAPPEETRLRRAGRAAPRSGASDRGWPQQPHDPAFALKKVVRSPVCSGREGSPSGPDMATDRSQKRGLPPSRPAGQPRPPLPARRTRAAAEGTRLRAGARSGSMRGGAVAPPRAAAGPPRPSRERRYVSGLCSSTRALERRVAAPRDAHHVLPWQAGGAPARARAGLGLPRHWKFLIEEFQTSTGS